MRKWTSRAKAQSRKSHALTQRYCGTLLICQQRMPPFLQLLAIRFQLGAQKKERKTKMTCEKAADLLISTIEENEQMLSSSLSRIYVRIERHLCAARNARFRIHWEEKAHNDGPPNVDKVDSNRKCKCDRECAIILTLHLQNSVVLMYGVRQY